MIQRLKDYRKSFKPIFQLITINYCFIQDLQQKVTYEKNIGFIQMAFKINISHKGKTYKLETENEVLVGKKISETLDGEEISEDLKGYTLEITGTSDISGIPGFKGLEGVSYHRKLLKFGPGMKNKGKGLRLRKTLRGEEISLKTIQINMKAIKEGSKKFEDLIKKEEKPAE